jgi:3D (Asp-Asp-Asp) domain-containing protein
MLRERGIGLGSAFLMKKTILAGLLGLLICGGATHASKPRPSGSVETTIENVRTTAYSFGPAHNGKYGNKNAIGGNLKTGSVRSAAADWSKWPVGTRFRVRETGQEYIVDDIGSAMVGTGTIDLFKPHNSQVRKWGVRRVTIEVIEWGSAERSLRILSDRTRHRHVRNMVESLQTQITSDQG